ncbi:ABC transporter ATP-binding protein [Rhodococcoides trifolii]|nr:ABC transporter ATP-binding protein [Rhodococcus trifolii]
MTSAIDVDNVVKTFGKTTALDGLTMSVEKGAIAGFLGPNGAGKSTTVRLLLGLLRADSGSITVLGRDPWKDSVALHRRLAYVPGDVDLWPTLTGGETIDLLGRMRGGLDTARRDELVDRFELDPRKKARTYSKGNRQKVALVAALSADVELLVLDEPTSGLDPLMEHVFQETVVEVARRGTTVLLSSHILAEVEKLCDTVTILRGGRTVQSGSLSDMRHLSRTHFDVATESDPAPLADIPGVHNVRRDGRNMTFDVDPDALAAVVRTVSDLGVRALTSTPPSLEDLFLREYSVTSK